MSNDDDSNDDDITCNDINDNDINIIITIETMMIVVIIDVSNINIKYNLLLYHMDDSNLNKK